MRLYSVLVILVSFVNLILCFMRDKNQSLLTRVTKFCAPLNQMTNPPPRILITRAYALFALLDQTFYFEVFFYSLHIERGAIEIHFYKSKSDKVVHSNIKVATKLHLGSTI